MGTPKINIRPGNPDFLDLPWDEPINDWAHDRLVEMPTGVHRHPVVFVGYTEGVYAIKELSARVANKEYQVLRRLESHTHRSAVPAGVVERGWLDPHAEGAGVVITRYVEHAFPYRRLISGPGFGSRRSHMLDALAGLLVELHLTGCFWGDCSLSNVLYRYDAGQIEAIMIDGETSAIHPELSDGQRQEELEIMKENLAGEMADVAAEAGTSIDEADLDIGSDVESRYHALWAELNDDLVVTRDDRYRIRERIARLNDLGFSVKDIELSPAEGGELVRMTTHVGGRTFNSDLLYERAGIEASENQAKLILGDLNYFLSKQKDTTSTSKSVGTFKWLAGIYEPLVLRIGEDWYGEDPVQGFCDYLGFRIREARRIGSDIEPFEAYSMWQRAGYPGFDPEDEA